MDTADKARNEEISVQDVVSEEYEGVRYAKDYSLKYQNAWFRDMVSLMKRQGLVLDNGCGVGYLAEFVPPSGIVGLDASGGMLRKAATRLDSGASTPSASSHRPMPTRR